MRFFPQVKENLTNCLIKNRMKSIDEKQNKSWTVKNSKFSYADFQVPMSIFKFALSSKTVRCLYPVLLDHPGASKTE